MTVPKNKTYPNELTKAYWKGKKKVGSVGGEPPSVYALAQSKINTGLGEALDEAQKAWNKINWKLLNAGQAATMYPEGGLVAAQKAKAKAQEYHTGTDFTDAVAKLNKAKAKATAAGKHKLLSKQANTAANDIATKLQAQVTLLTNVNLTDFDSAINDWQRYLAGFNDRYEEALRKVSEGLKGYSAKQDKANWDKSNLLSRSSEVSTIVKQAIAAKQANFGPYNATWATITTETQKIHQDYEDSQVSSADATAYIKQMTQLLSQVPAF